MPHNIELIRPLRRYSEPQPGRRYEIAAGNDLLSALPVDSYARLSPHLERVYLHRGDNVLQAAARVEYVHFPISNRISVLIHTASGASAEVGLIGNEGALDIMTLLCGTPPPLRAIIETPGHAYRVMPKVLRKQMAADPALRDVLLQYAGVRLLEMAGAVICNANHSVAQRLCRALLMRLHRGGPGTITITHEMMATILGSRRAGVTRAAVALRNEGIISYSRGRVVVLDRQALQAKSCECFAGFRTQNEALELTAKEFGAASATSIRTTPESRN